MKKKTGWGLRLTESRCEGTVLGRPFYERCRRKALYVHEERCYCAVHYPPTVRRREQQKRERILQKTAKRSEQLAAHGLQGDIVQACIRAMNAGWTEATLNKIKRVTEKYCKLAARTVQRRKEGK